MSQDHAVVWPNITVLAGRLYGLGAPVSLPEALPAIDPTGRLRPVDGRQPRPVAPCIATSEGDRCWLAAQTPKGYRPVLVGNELAMLPEMLLPVP